MNIRKKFKTKKCLYSWGTIYDPKTGEKLNLIADRVYCRTSEAWIMTYQKTKKDALKVIRIVFVD